VETVTFFHPVFGTKHEIELSEKNRDHFAAHLAKLEKYVSNAREVVEPVKVAPVKAAGSKSDPAKVREWAKANGFEVGDRGRIKADILEAYDKAQMPVAAPDEPVKLVEVSDEAAEFEVVDSTDLVEVEFPQDDEEQRELTDAEILALMGNLEESGEDVTLDSLAEAAKA
jgi:hypothetical protein